MSNPTRTAREEALRIGADLNESGRVQQLAHDYIELLAERDAALADKERLDKIERIIRSVYTDLTIRVERDGFVYWIDGDAFKCFRDAVDARIEFEWKYDAARKEKV